MKPDAILRKDEVTSRVRVVAVSGTNPVQIMLAQRIKRPDGKERTITQKIPVHDADLLMRLAAEAPPGTDIDATIVTEWTKNGYSAYLTDFRAIVGTDIFEKKLNEALQQSGEMFAKAS